MDDSKFHSSVNESDAESDREVETDEECYLKHSKTNHPVLKCKTLLWIPRHKLLITRMIKSFLCSDTNRVDQTKSLKATVTQSARDYSSRIYDINAEIAIVFLLGTIIQCYCFQESTDISDLILDNEKIKSCVTDPELFSTGMCNQEVRSALLE